MAKGSVVKRSGNWYAVYRISGKQKWEKAGPTKGGAERLLAKRLTEIHSGAFRDSTRIRFSDFAEKWLHDYASVSVKRSTYDSYALIVRLHLVPHFGNRWLNQITPGDVQTFLSRKTRDENLTPKTASNILVPLKRMFHHAVVWGILTADPTARIQKPRIEVPEMDYLSPDELQAFLGAVRAPYMPFFLTAVMTGMRRGELLALKWSDVDWDRSEIIVQRSLYKGGFVSPKTKAATRRIVMSPHLKDTLRAHNLQARRSDLELIFCNEHGHPLDPDNLVKREFLPALDRAGLRRIRFHDLRHTYASLLIAQGENVKFVQSQLGHTSAKTTLDRYSHLMPMTRAEAGVRLDRTVFQPSVRKLLEKPESEGIPENKKPSEVVGLQRAKIGSGGRI